MIHRLAARHVRQLLEMFPALTIVGPRQCGKTTLARQMRGVYFDMEAEGSALRLDADWDQLVAGKKLIVIDEAQQAPDVFRRLRGAIDADRKRNGRFLLLGSVSPSLMRNVSESLAGRMATLEMTPFILPELKVSQLDDLWLRGGFPDGGILDERMFRQWQRSYTQTIVSRDLPAWGLSAKPQQTLRLLSMLAAVNSQPLNASQLGASLSIDYKTVQSHVDFLEGAFLIRKLQPYFSNISKRLVKSPKIYWRDSGLLHSVLGVSSMDQLYQQPWLGFSWEGFIIEQTVATLAATRQAAQPYFFRTSDGHELDLVLDWGTERWAIEMKLTSNPSTELIKKLHKTADMIDAKRRIMVCRIARKIESPDLLVINVNGWLKSLMAGAR